MNNEVTYGDLPISFQVSVQEEIGGRIVSIPVLSFSGEDNLMSLCIAIGHKDTFYIAADTRSVSIGRDKEGRIVDTRILTDDYKKIYVVSDKMVLMAAGKNEFGINKASFTDVVSTIDFSSDAINKISMLLYEKFHPFMKQESEMQIAVLYNDNGELYCSQVFPHLPIPNILPMRCSKDGKRHPIRYGADWIAPYH